MKSATIKLYEGEVIISQRLGVAYCVLVNELTGELNVIEFRHRSFFVNEVECRMGLALTTSADESKLPVTQKIFMTRKPITERFAQAVRLFLKFTEDEILITKKDLDVLGTIFPEIEFVPIKDQGREVQYFLLNEKALRGRATSVNREKRATLIQAVRKCAAALWSYSVREREDGLVYETEKMFDNQILRWILLFHRFYSMTFWVLNVIKL